MLGIEGRGIYKSFYDIELTSGKTFECDTTNDVLETKLYVTDSEGKKLKEVLENGTEKDTEDNDTEDNNTENNDTENNNAQSPALRKHIKAPDTYVAGQKDYEFSQKYFSGVEAVYRYFANITKSASVSKKGVLKAKKRSPEPVLITAETEAGETVSQCRINILDKPKLIFPAFSPSDIDTKIDGYEYFRHDSTRTTAADYWESTDPSVVEVDSETGEITIKGAGKTKITAYFGEKGKKGTLKVKAKIKVK